MKQTYMLAILITLILLLTGPAGPAALAQEPLPGSSIRILAAGDRSIVLELAIAGFTPETIQQDGETYHRLLIPDMVQTARPGAPQLPTRGTLLGVGSPEGISVEILETEVETLTGYRLYPAPVMQVEGDILADPDAAAPRPIFAPDPAIYGTNRFYPDQVVEPGRPGYMRGQAVAQVQFYPVQYNPVSGEIRLYRRMVVRVSWEASLSAAGVDGRTASPAYEKLLKQTLLNYDLLQRPDPADLPQPSGGAGPIGAMDTTDRLKITVTENGIYKLTPADLPQPPFDLSTLNSGTIKIFNRGSEIPIYLTDDNSNNRFDGSDLLLFYGQAISDDLYTTENIYWLEAGGGEDGARMNLKSGSGSTVPASFPATLHAEEDTHYWLGEGSGNVSEDHWFWGDRIPFSSSRNYTLTVNNIAGPNAALRVRMKGYTVASHQTRIYLNGTLVSTESWSGQTVHDQAGSVTNLQEGANTVTVEPTNAGELIYLNWIELDYSDSYVAESNELFFGPPGAGSYQFNVTNFSSSDIRVFDITDPANVALINSPTITPGGGTYTVAFPDTATLSSRYLATAVYRTPAGIELDEASDLKNTANSADYLIITHEDFAGAAATLAAHRSNGGLAVMTVKIADVYDEFNDGIFSPQAIRDFLSYAYHNWSQAPTYVLLLGGATYDYRDVLGLSRKNYVPSQLIYVGPEDPNLDQTASDNRFVTVDGSDVLPDILIGRLAAQSSADATEMVNKIISYDQNPPAAPWNQHVLLVADEDPYNPPNTYAYEATANSLANRLPYYYTAHKVFESQVSDPKAEIIDDINNTGSILVNYAGHGNAESWTYQTLTKWDVGGLSNNRWPVVTVANCLNGYFVGSSSSMSEEFQRRQNRGAVAVWAPSNVGYPSDHRVMVEQFYDALFQTDYYELGAIATTAKMEAYGINSNLAILAETYILFGDPAQSLGVPDNYPYVASTTPSHNATSVAIDQPLQIVFNKPMNPATVNLSGPGAAGFSASWNDDNTVVTYTHPDFAYDTTLTYTITGQDTQGNPLGTGPAPSSWTFTTIVVAPKAVDLSGPSTGLPLANHTFTAAVIPSTAVLPITYEWEATGQDPVTHTGGGLNDAISFSWVTTGTKTITVSATNSYGTVSDSFEIFIDSTQIEPQQVVVSGPATGIPNLDYTFTAAVSPDTALQPITYAWQATGQDPVTHSDTNSLSDTITVSWGTTGTKTITVTATNSYGSATDTYQITLNSKEVVISGPVEGEISATHTFTATVNPDTAPQPITYTWQATGQDPVIHTDLGLTDTLPFSWTITGTKTITVTATNSNGPATDTYEIMINDSNPGPGPGSVFLPLVIKGN